MKLSKLGEHSLLEFIYSKLKTRGKKVVQGVGDDAAVLDYDKKYFLLLTTDSLIENIHFRKQWFSAEQIGKKAIEQNVSDIAAMGGSPTYALVSLQLPNSLDFSYFQKLYGGILKQCSAYSIQIIGGNISQAKEISISITMLGLVEKNRICLRKNAKKGDLICVTNDLGKSCVGLELLKKAKKGPSIDYFLNPKAKLKEGRILSGNGVKSMEDVSDGLSSEIHNICKASNVGAIIYQDKTPIKKETVNDAKKMGKDPIQCALYGGEEFELVFTGPKRLISKLRNKKIQFSVIGEIVDKSKGVSLISKGKPMKLSRGFEHFK